MKLKLLFGILLGLFVIQTALKANPTDVPKPEARRFIAISGRITSPSGEVIPGVSVVLKGTTIGTISDIDGFYNLNTPEKEGILLFSFVGYKTQEVPFKNTPVVDIILEAAENSLDEVVVVGYGTAKRGNITNAVSSMSSQDLEERPLNRIENAFSGQMAGVYAQTVNGEPGAELQIRVRGTGSINASNEPLYVVDGVPVDNLRGINPNDVQTIDVLKDASAAAIYGSRGSNGVVLVTTKKGKKGRPKLRFDSYVGVQEKESKIDVLNAEDWIQMRKESIDEQWIADGQAKNPKKIIKQAIAKIIEPLNC